MKKAISSFLILLILITSFTGCYNYNMEKASLPRKAATSDTIYVPKRALQLRFNDEYSPRSNEYYTLQQNIGFRAIERYVVEYELTNKYPVEFIVVIGGKDSIHYQFHSCDTCKIASVIKTYLTDQIVEIETATTELSVGKTIAVIYGVAGIITYIVVMNGLNKMKFDLRF